jgi:hypothetical protein
MATKKQIAAVTAAQKEVNKQLAATKKLSSVLAPRINTPDNIAFGLPAKPTLTAAEEKIFGVYEDSSGRIVPGARPTTTTTTTTPISTDDKNKIPVAPPITSSEDALFNVMLEAMKVYNIQNFASTWAKIRKDYPTISSEDAMNLLRYDPRYNGDYNQRFSGNAARIKNGFGALDEKTYLEMERGYSKIFKDYTLSTFDNTAQYATLIGNNVDVVEAGKRVSLAYDRILNADDAILNAWRQFFPQLSTSDLTAMMLDPKNQLAIMERKVQSAEIGGAALAQGLNASLAAQTIKSNRYSNLTTGTIGTENIKDANQSLAQTRADYEKIAGELPGAEKLSSIYGGQLEQYGQVEAEKANILGLASEKRKLEALIARESANFKSSAGTFGGSFKQPKGF